MSTITLSDSIPSPTGVAGVSRHWDGHARVGDFEADPTARTLPGWHRRPFRVLASSLFWLWFGSWVVGIGLAVGFDLTRNTTFLWAAGLIGSGGALIAFALFVCRRLRLREAISWRAAIGWGAVGGVVGIGFALLVETRWSDLVGHGWLGSAIALPAEETGKILVPVLLYLVGRYRSPRAGLMLALVSGVVFGCAVGVEYVVLGAEHPGSFASAVHHHTSNPMLTDLPAIEMAVTRPLMELVHPMLAMFIAAIAWRAGWGKHRFWPAFLGAWLIAAAVHSAIDITASFKYWSLAVLVVPPLIYVFLTRHAARELAPPDALAFNPPQWRPKVPKIHGLAAAT